MRRWLRALWLKWLFLFPGPWRKRGVEEIIVAMNDAVEEVVAARAYREEKTVLAETDEAGNLIFDDGVVVPFSHLFFRAVQGRWPRDHAEALAHVEELAPRREDWEE